MEENQLPTVERATAKQKPTTTPAPRFLPLDTIGVRLEGPGVNSKSPVFGVISNMSETGACVLTNLSLPENARVRLVITGGRAETTAVSARVVWCAERLEPVKELVGFLTGVTFASDSAATVQSLLSSGIFQLVP